jgi:predicted AAA+ superfamily ATPase
VADPMIRRLLPLPERSFFLLGPRSVGKSTWLSMALPGAACADLLESGTFLELSRSPGRLEAIVGARPERSWVVIDEVQKVPALLDEVHRLIERRRWRFALAGSSARKLRRGGVNLLGGRALTRFLGPLTSAELGERFDLDFSLAWGCLPPVQLDSASAADILQSYVHTYLKTEIQEEGTVRRLPPFARFLAVAGQLNGQVVNLQGIARDAAIPRSTVDGYVSILEDTLLAGMLTPYRAAAKVRERGHPKLFWFDPGVARAAAGLLFDPLDRTWLGAALETLLLHELRVYDHVSRRNRAIHYYAAGTGTSTEVDFVIETARRTSSAPPRVVLVEAKLAAQWDRRWERPMRSLSASGAVRVERMFGVYSGPRAYHFDGVDVLPVTEFLRRLHAGDVY